MRHCELSASKWIQTSALIILTLLVLGLMVVFYFYFEHPHRSDQVVLLSDGWTYETDRKPEPTLIEDLRNYFPLALDEVIVLRRIMREDVKNGALRILSDCQWVKIYLDGELLLDNQTDIPGRNPGRAIYHIPLPNNYADKELRVEASSPYTLYAYSPDPPLLGDVGALEAYQIGLSARSLMIGFILVLSGALFLIFSLFVIITHHESFKWDRFVFGMFSILIGVTTMGEWNIFSYVLSPPDAMNLYLSSVVLFPFPLMLYLFYQFKHCKIPVCVLLAIHILCALAAFTLALTGLWDLPMSLVFINPVYIILTAALSVLFVIEWIRKNNGLWLISMSFVFLILSAILAAVDFNRFFFLQQSLRTAGLILLIILTWISALREYARKRIEEQQNLHILSIKQQLAFESLEAATQYIRESSAARHETVHHLTALKALSDENDIYGIARYLDNLITSVSELGTVSYCENMLINSILHKYASDARMDGTDFTCDAFVPKELPFAENDLCILLMNALDNALEACRKLPEKRRRIRIHIRKKENFLVVACENSWNGELFPQDDGLYITTKPDKAAHGFGILAMRAIAEKYESALVVNTGVGDFSVKTALRFPQKYSKIASKG